MKRELSHLRPLSHNNNKKSFIDHRLVDVMDHVKETKTFINLLFRMNQPNFLKGKETLKKMKEMRNG